VKPLENLFKAKFHQTCGFLTSLDHFHEQDHFDLLEPSMADTRNIVFLGASYAGLAASHYFLKHVYPQLPKDSKFKYQVLLIDPSAKWVRTLCV
jgi:hypothetical protein